MFSSSSARISGIRRISRRFCATASEETRKPKTLNQRLAAMYYAPIIGPIFFGSCFTSLVSNSKDVRWFVETYMSAHLVDLVRNNWGINGEDGHARDVYLSTIEQLKEPVSVLITFKDGQKKLVDDIPGDMSVAEFVVHLADQLKVSLEDIVAIDFAPDTASDAPDAAYAAPLAKSSSSSLSSSLSTSLSDATLMWGRGLWYGYGDTCSTMGDRHAMGTTECALADKRLADGVIGGKVRLDANIGREEARRWEERKVTELKAALEGLEKERRGEGVSMRSIDAIDHDIKTMKRKLGSWF